MPDTLNYYTTSLFECNHVNIVKTYDSFLDNNEALWIVMEDVGRITLKNMVDEQHQMTEGKIATVSKQIVNALNYLHSNDLIYRNDKIFWRLVEK